MTDIKILSQKVAAVSDIYAGRFSINRNNDWYFLKFIEEVGELTKEYNNMCGRGKNSFTSDSDINALRAEFADVLAHLLLMAGALDVDLEKALDAKWFAHLA